MANSNGWLAMNTTAFFDIGEVMLHHFFSQIGEAYIQSGLEQGKPQDLANSAWVFAVLGLKDTKLWMPQQRKWPIE